MQLNEPQLPHNFLETICMLVLSGLNTLELIGTFVFLFTAYRTVLLAKEKFGSWHKMTENPSVSFLLYKAYRSTSESSVHQPMTLLMLWLWLMWPDVLFYLPMYKVVKVIVTAFLSFSSVPIFKHFGNS